MRRAIDHVAGLATGDPLDRSAPVDLHFQPDLLVDGRDDAGGDPGRGCLSIAVRDGHEQRRTHRTRRRRPVELGVADVRRCVRRRRSRAAPEVRVAELPPRPVRRVAQVRLGLLRGRALRTRPRHVLLPRQRPRTDRFRHVRPHGPRAARGDVRVRRPARPGDRGAPARPGRGGRRPGCARAGSVVSRHGDRNGRQATALSGAVALRLPGDRRRARRAPDLSRSRDRRSGSRHRRRWGADPAGRRSGACGGSLRPPDGQARVALVGTVRPERPCARARRGRSAGGGHPPTAGRPSRVRAGGHAGRPRARHRPDRRTRSVGHVPQRARHRRWIAGDRCPPSARRCARRAEVDAHSRFGSGCRDRGGRCSTTCSPRRGAPGCSR